MTASGPNTARPHAHNRPTADLLVSEMIDVDAVLALMGRGAAAPGNPAEATGFSWHMYAHHMTPLQVGQLAGAAGAGRLVVMHYAPNPMSPAQAQRYLNAIGENFDGNAELATDLGRY